MRCGRAVPSLILVIVVGVRAGEQAGACVESMGLGIYFCGSIRGGRNDVEIYGRIINYLKKFGRVFTEHIGSPDLVEKGN
ncbi:hypothetical protein chiPu_0025128 [Chiloscyllium punctatum]|uniref:Uncharacterized protein n=1 Tax=Chiloscyllium punctatum TaxID=137246 RepID=A0A401TEQ9_CHIPU|nr:hypothetical protein [Chiloscyllium punctatum]